MQTTGIGIVDTQHSSLFDKTLKNCHTTLNYSQPNFRPPDHSNLTRLIILWIMKGSSAASSSLDRRVITSACSRASHSVLSTNLHESRLLNVLSWLKIRNRKQRGNIYPSFYYFFQSISLCELMLQHKKSLVGSLLFVDQNIFDMTPLQKKFSQWIINY